MRQLRKLGFAVALCLVMGALVPSAAVADTLHCPSGGTKSEGQGTHSNSGLTLVVSGSTVSITGPAGAEVELCVKASGGITGIRTVTLDADGKATFQSDVLTDSGNLADVSYTVIYSVTEPPNGSEELATSGTQRVGGGGSAENVDAQPTGAFMYFEGQLTGGVLVALLLTAVATSIALRRLLNRRSSA